MNVLFVTNYFGLHGSSISLLSLAAGLKKYGHRLYFVAEDGDLRYKFDTIAEDICILRKHRYLPSIRNILLIKKMIDEWHVDIVIGIGKFIIIECQFVSLLFNKKIPISMMNFSPRSYHWQAHPKWHIPKVGFLTVNCQFYKDTSICTYGWPAEYIYLLGARYDVPEKIVIKKISQTERCKVAFVRRLDKTKYQSIIKCLGQLEEWKVWDRFSVKIVGSGSHEHAVLRKIAEIQQELQEADITFLGKKDYIEDLMDKSDVIIGSERVVVEGVIHGCLTLLANNEGLIDIVKPDNIVEYSYDNFFGYNYPKVDHFNIKKELFHLLSNNNEVKKIVDGNFKFVKEHFDVDHGSEVLHKLIKLSSHNKVNMWDLIISLYRVLKSWISVYVFLCKNKIFGLF